MTGFLKQKGGYQQLRVYKVTEIIYDLTFHFCNRYLRRGDRTIDQMVQAARSGKQNIAEGSMAANTSSKTEIRLTNVALASLEELKLDYLDYLRVRNKPRWDAENPRYKKMRRYVQTQAFIEQYSTLFPRLSDEELANLALTLIMQASHLLKKLIDSQQEIFLKEGGISEQMTRARIAARSKQ